MHSKSSQNAEAAWDAVPGEEIAVDFKDAGYEEIGGDECGDLLPGDESLPLSKEGQAEHDLFDVPPPGGDLYPPRGIAEVRDLKVRELKGPGFWPPSVPIGKVLETTPELSVDVYVNLPDGRSWNLELAIPEGGEKFTADELLREIGEHFDSVALFMGKAITPVRRAVLGLTGMATAGTRPVKDDPQA